MVKKPSATIEEVEVNGSSLASNEAPDETIPEITYFKVGDRGYVLHPLTGEHYFEYQRKHLKDAYSADLWIISQAYTDAQTGIPMTQADARNLSDSEFAEFSAVFSSFESFITVLDDKKFVNSYHYKVGDITVTRKRISGIYFSQFRADVASDPIGAFRKYLLLAYQVNGENITAEMLSCPYPEGIGYIVAGAISTQILNFLVQPRTTQI